MIVQSSSRIVIGQDDFCIRYVLGCLEPPREGSRLVGLPNIRECRYSDVDQVIHTIEAVRLPSNSVPIGNQGRPVHGAMVSIARHVRGVAGEGIVGHQTEIETGDGGVGIGIRAVGGFLEVGEAVAIGVLVGVVGYVDGDALGWRWLRRRLW